MMTPWILGIATAAVLIVPGIQDKPKLAANRSDEPFAEEFSLPKAVAFMDSATRIWKSKHNCITCHTNGLYLVARAQVSTKAKAYAETRAFAKQYLARILAQNPKSKGRHGSIEGMVATASFLAISDVATTGRLDELTVRGLDHIWKAQDENGAWGKWLKCKWPPYEIDDHFGVTLAALALGNTPRKYRRTKLATRGGTRLRSYLRLHKPSNPHQKGMMLWASAKLDGIVNAKTRKAWQNELRALQRPDGGWRLVDLGKGKWKRDKDDEKTLPSDAYATGFTIFVLRQSGVPRQDQAIEQGLAWLRSKQRQSGRWFVRSPRRDGKHFISHAATQFAVMAIIACGGGAPKK